MCAFSAIPRHRHLLRGSTFERMKRERKWEGAQRGGRAKKAEDRVGDRARPARQDK